MIPSDVKYTQDHEWLKTTGDVATVGITEHAQDQLGDVVFVELPAVGTHIKQGVGFGTVESVKAVSDLFAPVSGEVIEINTELASTPELVNSNPYDKAWMIKVKLSNPAELESLLSPADYEKLIG
jgi:glycine cleavage system H protein